MSGMDFRRALTLSTLVLLLTLGLGASDHPAKPRGRAEASHKFIHSVTSAYSHLRYDVHYADNVFVLSAEPTVLAANCSQDGTLLLTMSSEQPLSDWGPGTLLVGDKKLGCMKDGRPRPFYQKLQPQPPEHVSQTPDGHHVVLLHTEEASLLSCFKQADIHFRSVPLNHDAHPFKSNSSMLSTEQGRKLLIFGGTYQASVNPTLDIISINSNSDGGGASDPLLSILDEDGVTIGCRECFASLTLGFTFAIRISYGIFYVNIDSLEVSVDGELAWGAGFEAHAPRKVNIVGQSRELFNEYLNDISFYIGPIPIWVDFYGRLEGSGALDTASAGDVSTGIQYRRGVRWGVEYRYGTLREIREMYEDFQFTPPTIDIPDEASIDLQVKPVVVADLWGIVPFVFGPTATLRFELGEDVRPSCSNLGYQLSYRMKLGFGVDPIQIQIPEWCVSDWFGPCIGGGTITFTLGGILPWWRAFTLIPMTPISGAQGCLASAAELASSQDSEDSLSASPTGEWKLGDWGVCSKYCGGGQVTRPVTCVNADDNDEELEESYCEEPKPSSSEPCHEYSCDSICRASQADELDACVVDTTPSSFALHPLTITFGLNHVCSGYNHPEVKPQFKTRCTWELFYNDECNSECNTDKCNQDNGKCKQQDQQVTACQEHGSGSCSDCLAVDQGGTLCGWCASSSTCLPGTLSGPRRSDACATEDWKADTCEEPVPPLEFSSPGKDQTFEAGTTLQIDWTGGMKEGAVTLELASPSSDLISGAGLPTDDIDTSLTPYSWEIPSSLEPGPYFFVISDGSSTAVSNAFDVTAPPVPSDTYTWSTGSWGACSRVCGPDGTQSRSVQCIQNVGSSSATQVADSQCSGTKPSSSRACNTNPCQEIDLFLEVPDSSVSTVAGSGISVKWQGGKRYSQVKIEVRKATNGLTSTTRLNETEFPWQQELFGLPLSLDNTGNYAWSLPSSMSSGRYLMRITSSSDANNVYTLEDPFVVKASVQYSLMVIPGQPKAAASIGNLTSLSVTLWGTVESTTASLAMTDSTDEGNGIVAWLFQLTSVGSLVRITYEPIGGVLDGAGAVAVHDGNQLNQIGTSLMVPEGTKEVRPVCGQFSSSCAECNRVPGCGYCKATSKCMALNPSNAQRPIFGWCPTEEWSSDVQSCGDACRLVNYCDGCVRTLGCGWCAETCQCLSTAIGAGTSINYGDGTIEIPASCPVSSWVDLPQGQTCGALKGDSCSAGRLSAQAHSDLNFTEDGQARLLVSAQGSTPCRTCASIDCGAHGRCRAEGPNVQCRCRDGYSGEFCQNPPEPCFGKGCSDTGVCYLTTDTNEEKCACLLGFPGSTCTSSSGSASRRLLQISGSGSCSDPIPVDPTTSLTLNPCNMGDSTGRSESDAVMQLGPLDTTTEITIEASGIDTVLSIFTSCPDSSSGTSQVAYDDDGGVELGSKILLTAEAGTSYYVVVEPFSSYTCGNASVVFTERTGPVLQPPSPSLSSGSASCSDPIPVEPSSSLTLNPCNTGDSTGRPESDAVMLLGPLDTSREITIDASGIDSVLSVFTSCPDSSNGQSQVAYDDDGGVGLGSRITLSAASGTQYFVVLEPYDSYSCGSASVVLSDTVQASPPPSPAISGSASCSDPIPVEPSSSLTLNPCNTGDSTGRPESDAVMLLGPLDTTKEITVETSGIDTVLSIFTSCPANSFGPSQIAYNDDGGVALGSKIVFTAEAGSSYYIVLEPYAASNCGSTSVMLSESVASPPPSPTLSLSEGSASCSDPIPVEPSSSLALNPCNTGDSTGRPESDAVMRLGPLGTSREITIEASGIDTVLSVFTSCPASSFGPSQIAYDDDGGVGFGSKITLSAEAGTEYYIVLEPYDSSTCGLASVVLGESLPPAPMSPLSPLAPSPPQGFSRPTWDVVVTPEGLGYFFVGEHLTNSEAQSYCEENYGGGLLKVANEQELSSSGGTIAQGYFTQRSGTFLQYWMGYQYVQNTWQAVGGDASGSGVSQYARQKLDDDAGEYSFFYTGDCAYGDIVAGETVGLIFSDSCFNTRPFICQARYNSSSAALPPLPPSAPPPPPQTTTVDSPPPSPAPPSPAAPFPPVPSIPPPEQRGTCFNWRVLEAPEGATLSDPTAETTEVLGAVPGKYKFALIMADSDGSENTVTLDSTVETSALSPPPSSGTAPPPALSPPPPSSSTATPSPSPSPPPSPPASPPPVGSIEEQESSRCRSTDAKARTSLTFDLDFESLNRAEFRRTLQDDLQRSLPAKFPDDFSFSGDECSSFVKVVDLKQGSVVAALDIDLGAGKDSQDAENFEKGLESLSKEDVEGLFEDQQLRGSVSDQGFVVEEEAGDDASMLRLGIVVQVLFAAFTIIAGFL